MHPIDDAVRLLREKKAEARPAERRPEGPPRWLVLGHFAFAAAAFWLFSAAFLYGSGRFLGFDFQARWVLGLVHTLTLGWAAMTLLGAQLQMTSSHGGVSLYRPRLAIAGWVLLCLGAASFVGLLWAGSARYWLGAAVAASGLSLYLIVLIGTILGSKTRDATYWHFANAFFYLASLALVGLLLAYDRQRGVVLADPDGALVAHVHLALVGWVSLSIAGASYRLVPAVAAYRAGVSRLPSRLLLALANAGLLGLAVDGLFLGRRALPLWAGLLAAAYALYAWQALRGPRPSVSPSAALTYVALAGGGAWAALGLGLAFGWLPSDAERRAAYVFAALVGWVTPNILAQVHKIFPFLVWLALSKRLPPERLPEWEQLGSPRLAWAEAALLAGAVAAGLLGFLGESPSALRACGALLLGCASCYAAGTLRTFSHLIHAQVFGATFECPLH